MKSSIEAKKLILLLVVFIIFSTTGIFMKLASMEVFLSLPFIFYYSCELGIIALYAILWQIVLKRIPLTLAFMSKSITIVFALLIAHFIFGEKITLNNIIGSFIIISGIVYLNWNK